MRRALLAFFFAPLLLCASAAAQPAPNSPAPRTIETSGHGEASAKPDEMIVSFSVTSTAPTADRCTELHAEKMRKLVDLLKQRIGDTGKVETSNFTISPNYENALATPTPSAAPAQAEFGGPWKFTSNVTAQSDKLEDIGALIEVAMKAGASRVFTSGLVDLSTDVPMRTAAGIAVAGTMATFNQNAAPAGSTKRVAQVTMEIDADGATPDQSVRAGSRVTDAVVKALRDSIGKRDAVQIDSFNVNPTNSQQVQSYVPPQQYVQRQTGMTANTTISVETTKLDFLGPILSEGLTNGAANLQQVAFTLKEDDDARKQAIEKASADAKTKAETLANSMGVKLGTILRITTNASVRPEILYGNGFGRMMMHTATLEASTTATMPVLPREVPYAADVTVTYEIE